MGGYDADILVPAAAGGGRKAKDAVLSSLPYRTYRRQHSVSFCNLHCILDIQMEIVRPCSFIQRTIRGQAFFLQVLPEAVDLFPVLLTHLLCLFTPSESINYNNYHVYPESRYAQNGRAAYPSSILHK